MLISIYSIISKKECIILRPRLRLFFHINITDLMTGKKFENSDELLSSKHNFEQNTKISTFADIYYSRLFDSRHFKVVYMKEQIGLSKK